MTLQELDYQKLSWETLQTKMLITEKVLTLFKQKITKEEKKECGKKRSERGREGAQEADLCEKPINRSVNQSTNQSIIMQNLSFYLVKQTLIIINNLRSRK